MPKRTVFTTKRIMAQQDWIASVTHDADDGAWQFLGSEPSSEQEAALVSLAEMIEIDPSIESLHDLPLGWSAHRESPRGNWLRKAQA